MSLLAYRLRPLPGAVLAGLLVVLLTTAWWLSPRLGANEAIRFVQFTAVPLGLAAAFTVSRDVDAPEPVLASSPRPYWRTPALRASLWVIVAGSVVGLVGEVVDARVLEPLPLDAAVGFAGADLIFVVGLAFVFSIRWGSFIGGASALVSLVTFAIAQKVWHRWPLRILDTVGVPGWRQTRAWLLFAGTTCVVAGLLYLRARGLPIRTWFSEPPYSREWVDRT